MSTNVVSLRVNLKESILNVSTVRNDMNKFFFFLRIFILLFALPFLIECHLKCRAAKIKFLKQKLIISEDILIRLTRGNLVSIICIWGLRAWLLCVVYLSYVCVKTTNWKWWREAGSVSSDKIINVQCFKIGMSVLTVTLFVFLWNRKLLTLLFGMSVISITYWSLISAANFGNHPNTRTHTQTCTCKFSRREILIISNRIL